MYFNSEPKWQKELIRDIAKEYGIDIRIVRQMVYYPFLFTRDKMAKDEDWRPIRHRYFGAFTLKGRERNKMEKKQKVTKDE